MQQEGKTLIRVWNSRLPGTRDLWRSTIWHENWHLGTGLCFVRNDGFEESIWSWSKYQHVYVSSPDTYVINTACKSKHTLGFNLKVKIRGFRNSYDPYHGLPDRDTVQTGEYHTTWSHNREEFSDTELTCFIILTDIRINCQESSSLPARAT
jgi:hypothetical protein